MNEVEYVDSISFLRKSIYVNEEEENHELEENREATQNAVTLFGVNRDNFEQVKDFFEKNDLYPRYYFVHPSLDGKFSDSLTNEDDLFLSSVGSVNVSTKDLPDNDSDDIYQETPSNIENLLGNWIYAEFEQDIKDIQCISSIIKISDTFVVGCYIGYYQYEDIEQVPSRKKQEKEQKEIKIFKIPPSDEDLTDLPYEEKGFVVKLQEFILGECKIWGGKKA